MARNRQIAGLLLATGLSAGSPGAHAETISAEARLESGTVFVGESFRFEIHVNGVDQSDRPDTGGLKGFRAQYGGGRNTSSQQITYINGRMNRVEQRSYVHSYLLVAEQEGQLTIPAIPVDAAGKTVYTKPLQVKANKPHEIDDFKLVMELSNESPHMGEPVILSVTWYISAHVKLGPFAVPALSDDAFFVDDTPVDRRKETLEVQVGTGITISEKSHTTLLGEPYTAIQFRKVLIPKQSGAIKLDPSTVMFHAMVGYKPPQRNRRSMFDNFFGNSGKQPIYKKVVIPSNELLMQVKPLPLSGRPDGFAGHVGTYRIEASASPLQVSVGDPVHLVVAVSGPEYLKHLPPPPLHEQTTLIDDFKVPTQPPEGEMQGSAKIFTQTIRALRPDVASIPPIELPYFDTRHSEYRMARSEPIRIQVRESRVVTAFDGEGIQLGGGPTAVEGWARGIAHNYEDTGALVNQVYGPAAWISSPAWIAALSLPPMLYGFATAMVLVRQSRKRESASTRTRRALRGLEEAARNTKGKDPASVAGETLDALRGYLGSKLEIPTSALTFSDAEAPLLDREVAEDLLAELRAIFNACEAGRYGGTDDEELREVADRSLALARRLEEVLK